MDFNKLFLILLINHILNETNTISVPKYTEIRYSEKIVCLPRSIRRGRKRPFLMVFDSLGSDHITAVFHRFVNERKRSDTPFSGRLQQLLTVYDTTKIVRNNITTKWSIYSP
jgi:hypothetical protein